MAILCAKVFISRIVFFSYFIMACIFSIIIILHLVLDSRASLHQNLTHEPIIPTTQNLIRVTTLIIGEGS